MKCAVAEESTFQRLATTFGTPARRKAAARLPGPASPSSPARPVEHADSTAKRRARKSADAMLSGPRRLIAESLPKESLETSRPIASGPEMAWPAKWKALVWEKLCTIAAAVACL